MPQYKRARVTRALLIILINGRAQIYRRESLLCGIHECVCVCVPLEEGSCAGATNISPTTKAAATHRTVALCVAAVDRPSLL